MLAMGIATVLQAKPVEKSGRWEAGDTVVTISIYSNDTTLGTVSGSGIYHLYDTVCVLPSAAEGCRYLHMASGPRDIPFEFLATGDITDTAYFERIEGDTIGYCADTLRETRRDDMGATTEWGIRVPTVMRRARQLIAVQMYYYAAEGDYSLNVYVGDSLGGSLPVYTGVYTLSGEEGWRTLALDSVLTFHHTKTLWITLSYTDTSAATHYPISCAPYCGNSDGSWYHFPSGWQTYNQQGVYCSWMLRAVFDSRERYHVAAAPNDINGGDVTGMGYYTPGATVVLHAIPKNGYRFSFWSNGSEDNPLHFILTSDTTFIAFFEPITGIEEVESGKWNVEISDLTLRVTNLTGEPVGLYDVAGRLLATYHTRAITHRFSSPGVYLLRCGATTKKIVATR